MALLVWCGWMVGVWIGWMRGECGLQYVWGAWIAVDVWSEYGGRK